jgi:hypothetical protein
MSSYCISFAFGKQPPCVAADVLLLASNSMFGIVDPQSFTSPQYTSVLSSTLGFHVFGSDLVSIESIFGIIFFKAL